MDSTDDNLSLKWNNFRSSLAEGFHDFLQEEMMVDVTLAAEGKFLQAHKLVLSVCSPYFKNLFNVNPCKHPIVILKDVSHNELSYVLQFMYKGEVGVKHEELPSFLKLADTLKLKGLVGVNVECGNDASQIHSDLCGVKRRKGIQCSDSKTNNVESESDISRLKELRPTRKKRRLRNVTNSERFRISHSEKLRSGKSDLEPQSETAADEDCSFVDGENSDFGKLFVNNDKGVEDRDSQSARDDDDLDDGKTSAEECDFSMDLFDSSSEAEQAPQGIIQTLR